MSCANGQLDGICGSIVHFPLLITSDEWDFYVNNRDWTDAIQQSATALHVINGNGVASAGRATANYCFDAEGRSTGVTGVQQVVAAFKSALQQTSEIVKPEE